MRVGTLVVLGILLVSMGAATATPAYTPPGHLQTPPGSSPTVFSQSINGTTGAAATPPPVAARAGDAVFVGIFGVSKTSITSVTDNDSNKYTMQSKRLVNITGGGTDSYCEVWIATNVAATSFLGVTVVQSGPQKLIVGVVDVTGVNASRPVDANGSGSVGISAVAADTVKTHSPRDLVLLMTGFVGRVAISAVGGDAIVNSTSVSLGGTHASAADLNETQVAPGTVSLKAASNVSHEWEAIAIAFASGAPRAPTGLTVGSVTTTTVPLNWTQPPGVVSNNTVYVGSGSICNGTVMGHTTGGAASAYTVVGLTPGATYCFYVTAWNGTNESGPSSIVTATTAHVPPRPTGLVETAVTATSVSLSWGNPSGPLVNNTVFYETACGAYSHAYPTPGVASAATITGLISGTSYCFAVAAWNGTGMSDLSNTVNATPGSVPAAPTTLHTTGITTTTVSLAWTQPPGFVLNNTVYTGTSCGAWNIGVLTTAGASTTRTVSGLTTGTSYCFAVSAWNGTGQSLLSSTITVVTAHNPPPPTGMAVGTVTTVTVSLTWTNPNGPLTNDTVFQAVSAPSAICPSTGGYTTAYNLATGNSYTVTGLVSGAFYCFAVAAWNSTGMSPLDPIGTSVETGHVPLAPVALMVTSQTSTTVSLGWMNPPGPLTNDTVFVVSSSFGATCSSTGGYTSGYNVPSGETYTVAGLTSGNHYCLAVAAWNSTGMSSLDPLATSIKTLHVPSAPMGLAVTSITSTTVSLAWTNPPGPVANDTLYQAPAAFGTQCQSTGYSSGYNVVTGTTYNVNGLITGDFYCFAVVAWNTTGASPLDVLATSVRTLHVPPAPTALAVTAFTSTTVSLTWTNPYGAISNVTVFWGTTCGNYPNTQSVSGPAEAFSVNALTPGTKYCLAVTASNATGMSPLSGPVVATTAVSPAPTLFGVSVAEGVALLIANGVLWVLVGVEVLILWRQRTRRQQIQNLRSYPREVGVASPQAGTTPRR
ncbi:MAG: fibronectin type III domain-containing protein [Thermoplasmata archaeon]|nr:fibronectin type III domain-containing protein [Thermoplasmata archaeon]